VKTISIVSSSRADFGHLYWPLKRMQEHPDLNPRLVVTGAHLSPEFGETVTEIEQAGFAIEEKIECLLSSDTDVGMARTIGLATLSLADYLGRTRPDILLLIADRYEMLAPASAALALRIPMAHIEGGEISEGAIDDAVRNALTKLAHVHLTPTAAAAARVLAMGEERWRVHQVGAPSLDHIAQGNLPCDRELEEALGFLPNRRTCVAAMHPVTLQERTTIEAESFFRSLEGLERVVFCFPNADAGSRQLIATARNFCDTNRRTDIFVNLSPRLYWGLLARAGVLIGNSSSGIMETPSLQLPTVNIGHRQHGRTRAANIIDVAADAGPIRNAIVAALDPEFRSSLAGLVNPYGDGSAGEKIAEVLAAAPGREILLHKRALPLGDTGFAHD
jgi:UDP-N-acetylglucosamine 2-epimerase (non-hydrolysing)/GDP/UDP-N,N'-diacetylbacillosamine 2-epimerase (hydrolysing)